MNETTLKFRILNPLNFDYRAIVIFQTKKDNKTQQLSNNCFLALHDLLYTRTIIFFL